MTFSPATGSERIMAYNTTSPQETQGALNDESAIEEGARNLYQIHELDALRLLRLQLNRAIEWAERDQPDPLPAYVTTDQALGPLAGLLVVEVTAIPDQIIVQVGIVGTDRLGTDYDVNDIDDARKAVAELLGPGRRVEWVSGGTFLIQLSAEELAELKENDWFVRASERYSIEAEMP